MMDYAWILLNEVECNELVMDISIGQDPVETSCIGRATWNDQIFWSQEVRTSSQQISPILFLHHEILRSADFLGDMPLGEWHSDSWLLVGPGQIFQTATYYFKSGRFWVFKAILNPQSLFPIISRPPITNDPPEEKILVQQNYKTHGGLLY